MNNNVIASGDLVAAEELGDSCVFFTDANGEPVIWLTEEGMYYRGKLVKDAGEAYRGMLAFLNHSNSDLQTGADHRQIDTGIVLDAVNSLAALTRYATEHIQAHKEQKDYMLEDLADADKAASVLIEWLDADPTIQEEKSNEHR